MQLPSWCRMPLCMGPCSYVVYLLGLEERGAVVQLGRAGFAWRIPLFLSMSLVRRWSPLGRILAGLPRMAVWGGLTGRGRVGSCSRWSTAACLVRSRLVALAVDFYSAFFAAMRCLPWALLSGLLPGLLDLSGLGCFTFHLSHVGEGVLVGPSMHRIGIKDVNVRQSNLRASAGRHLRQYSICRATELKPPFVFPKQPSTWRQASSYRRANASRCPVDIQSLRSLAQWRQRVGSLLAQMEGIITDPAAWLRGRGAGMQRCAAPPMCFARRRVCERRLWLQHGRQPVRYGTKWKTWLCGVWWRFFNACLLVSVFFAGVQNPALDQGRAHG